MKIRVLDHGYVELVEAWGTGHAGQCDRLVVHADAEDYECGIIEAARQSTQGSFRGWKEDAKLLKRLYNHKHATPFEFAGLIIEVQAPITVFREWHRHRTQGYSEASARYTMLPDLYYMPEQDDVFARGNAKTSNRQAQGIKAGLSIEDTMKWLGDVDHAYRQLENIYQAGLSVGVPKELARITMPVGHYSKMRAVGNLRNWLAFMTLRCAPEAQKEIQLFSSALADLIKALFPRTHQLWLDEPRVRCENTHAPILHAEGPCPLCEALGITGV